MLENVHMSKPVPVSLPLPTDDPLCTLGEDRSGHVSSPCPTTTGSRAVAARRPKQAALGGQYLVLSYECVCVCVCVCVYARLSAYSCACVYAWAYVRGYVIDPH